MPDETRPLPGPDDGRDPSRDRPVERDVAHPTRPVGSADEPPPDPGQRGWRRFGGRDMQAAIASGVLLAATFIIASVWHPAAVTAFVLAIVLVGVVEATGVVTAQGHRAALPVLLVASVVMFVGAYRAGAAGQAVGVAVLFVGAVVWELGDPGRRHVFARIAGTCLLGLWMPFLASYAVLLVRRPEDGWVAIIAAVGVAVVSDIGAFAVGTRFGRRKLAPSVSPGKTWEGVAGGIGIVVLVAAVVLPVLGTGQMFSPLSAMLFAVLVAAAGVVGDLTESMMKRDLGVKDIGGLIPGHGGVLDRADSLLFALPTGYYVLAALGH